MTTATVSTVVEHSSDATFRTWVAEVIAQLLAVGVTQTADTGQINTATVTRPGTNTAAGYAIFRFNDTAHGTSPIFIKLEFGTAASATNPQMWITIGTGSNGAGTLSGTVGTRVAVGSGVAISSTITPYVSRFCYNTVQGVLWMSWKQNGGGTAGASMAGFSIARSSDAAGAVTTDAVTLIANASSANGSTSSSGAAQHISYLTSTAYLTTSPLQAISPGNWGVFPCAPAVSLYSSNIQVGMGFQYTPILGINANLGLVLNAEITLGGTATAALVGATTHTFINVGCFHGGNTLTAASYPNANFGTFLLWE